MTMGITLMDMPDSTFESATAIPIVMSPWCMRIPIGPICTTAIPIEPAGPPGVPHQKVTTSMAPAKAAIVAYPVTWW
jgi:hypothetical protein